MTDALVIRPDLIDHEVCDGIVKDFCLKLGHMNAKRIEQDQNVTLPLKSLWAEGTEDYVFFKRWVPTLSYYLAGMNAWEGIRPDYTAVVMLQNGGGHILHADNRKLTDEPNHCAWREKTCRLYLNDGGGVEFTGGELHLPKLGVTVKPRKGLFVGFPCDLEFQHEVYSVTEGRRFALAVWFTHDASKWEKW